MSTNTYEALLNYTQSLELSFSSTKIRKLLTTFRVYLASAFGLSIGYTEEEVAKSLSKLPLKRFVEKALAQFEIAFAETVNSITDEEEKKKKKATLYNDRSNLKSFLSWISEQKWHSSFQKLNSDSSKRAPRARKGKSLQATRRGKGKNLYARQYALPEAILQKEYSLLHQDLKFLEAYAVLKAPPEGLERGDQAAIRDTTFANHRTSIRRFYGWAIGVKSRLEQEKLTTKLQKVINNLASNSKDQGLQNQKQELERQLSELRAKPEESLSPLKYRKVEILIELSHLRSKFSKNLRDRKRQLERLVAQIDKCSLEIMLDTTLFNRFISWGINECSNGGGWAIAHYSSGIFVTKFLGRTRDYDQSYISSIIDDLSIKQKACIASYKPNVRKDKSEKWLTLEQQDAIVNHLEDCTAEYDYRGVERSLIKILRSKQRHLTVLFLEHYPVRVYELTILESNKTLKWGTDPETKREGYYCEFSAEQTKTGEPKIWFLDPDVFNEPLTQWLQVWRPKAGVDHNFLFFTLNKGAYGQQMTCHALGEMVKNCVFIASRDLKLAAQDELTKLKSEGKTEEEARQSLSRKHQCFIDIEPRRTNIHYWRHLVSTAIRKADASLSQLKALHKIIGNSVEIGNTVYNQLELEEETADATSWRRTLIGTTGLSEQTLDRYKERLLAAALAIMSKKQLNRLRDLGYNV